MQSASLPAVSQTAFPTRTNVTFLASLTERDSCILRRALRKLNGHATDFNEASRALREAVAELIPAGRVYLIGHTQRGPVIGSLITGVGIGIGDGHVELMHTRAGGQPTTLGRFASP